MVDFSVPLAFLGAIPARLLDTLSKEDFERLASYARAPKGPAVFHGRPGRGKTYAACAVLNGWRYFHPQASCGFCSVSELNQIWLANFEHQASNFDLLRRLKDYEYLVLDDFGIRKPSEGFMDFFYCFVNFRCDMHLPTIYTSNLDAKETAAFFGDRIVSRLKQGLMLEFKGKDLRGTQIEMQLSS